MPAPSATDPIDVVDEDDRVIGESPRGSVIAAGLNFRTAHVLVHSDQGVLLQHLSADRGRHGGRWGSTVAAYLHAGESYREAAERRTAEELGVAIGLRDHGTVTTRDEESIKFVALFTADWDGRSFADDAKLVEQVRLWTFPEIDRTMHDEPARFTPTFRGVFARFVAAPT